MLLSRAGRKHKPFGAKSTISSAVTMSVLSRRSFLAISMIPILLRSQGSGQTSRSLQERIPKADPKKYAEIRDGQDWKNPFLFVRADGIELLNRASPGHVVPVESIPEVLNGLPDSAWPYGLVIGVGDAGIVGSNDDRPKIERTRARLFQLLKELGVAVGFWPAPA
jgi:hypothetical protein